MKKGPQHFVFADCEIWAEPSDFTANYRILVEEASF